MSAANARVENPGRQTDQLVVINIPGSDVTDFFVCRAAVKHRRAAVLSLKRAVLLQTPSQEDREVHRRKETGL